ncbi:MAG: hypothetical protein WC370_06620 [Dehalococcoidales bacterium]|jgi:hypothetical protein
MARMTVQVKAAILGDVPVEKRFWCHDGRYLKNLEELQEALKQMTDDVFQYHANAEKTDFSNWVNDVIGDEKLSRDLLKCTCRTEATSAVAARVKYLKRIK